MSEHKEELSILSTEEGNQPKAGEGTSIEIIKLQQEVKEQEDKYLRLLAEMENMRKRMQKEKEEMLRLSTENTIAEFLSPIDNFENALGFAHQASEETKNWAIGFQMILSQFREILHEHRIASFQAKGAPFDARYHEAIEMEETELFKEGTVMQEFSKGYKCGERVIRPAKVKVAKSLQKDLKETIK